METERKPRGKEQVYADCISTRRKCLKCILGQKKDYPLEGVPGPYTCDLGKHSTDGILPGEIVIPLTKLESLLY